MKKVISLILFFILILDSSVFALDIPDLKTWIKVWQVGNLPDVININYTDITLQNAWKEIVSYMWKENFKTKIVMSEWIYLELNKDKLDKVFSKTSDVKTKLLNLKTKNISAWEIFLNPIKFTQYPDRVSVEQTFTINFKNKQEFENYKKNIDTSKNVVWNKDVDKKTIEWLFKECKLEADCFKWLTDNQIKTKILENLKNWEMEIEITESSDFNLIPLDIANLKEIESPNFNLNLEPNQVRISKSEIDRRFSKIYEFKKSNPVFSWSILNNEYFSWSLDNLPDIEELEDIVAPRRALAWPIESQNNNPPSARDSSPQEFCSYYFSQQEENYQKCIDLKNRIDWWSTRTSSQIMLNWFTIWHSWSNRIWKRIRVRKPRKPWERTTVLRARANRNFWYWVWIRIPFLVDSSINDLHRYINQPWSVEFKTKISMRDFTPNNYRTLNIPEDKIFWWKEFVLEARASLSVKIVVCGETIIDRSFWLWSLIPDTVEWKTADWINLSKDFTPPLNNSNDINILSAVIPVPLVNLWAASISFWINIDSSLTGKMKADIIKQNIRWRDETIEYTNNSWKNYEMFVNHSNNCPITFSWALWWACVSWLRLWNFEYIPVLNFDIWASVILEVDVPIRWSESWDFWPYNIYSFKIDPGVWLKKHRWTISQTANLNILSYDMWIAKSAEKQRLDAIISVQNESINVDNQEINTTDSTDAFIWVKIKEDFTNYYDKMWSWTKTPEISWVWINDNKYNSFSWVYNDSKNYNQYFSKDSFTNLKLDEINDIYIKIYDENLELINEKIEAYENLYLNTKNIEDKERYKLSLKKLYDLKKYYELRYSIFKKFIR